MLVAIFVVYRCELVVVLFLGGREFTSQEGCNRYESVKKENNKKERERKEEREKVKVKESRNPKSFYMKLSGQVKKKKNLNKIKKSFRIESQSAYWASRLIVQ